jgi:hypothetical protein
MRLLKVLTGVCMLLMAQFSHAQGPENYDENGNFIQPSKGFLAGLYLGTYFANKHTASLYDGYGFDYEENRRTFEDSWMYEKIINQYGGGYGQQDYIAEALGVQPGEWNFDESDMPVNMRYKTAFAVGFTGRYSVDKKNAVLLNVNAAILTAVGNFTITTKPLPGSTQINNAIKTYNIRGKEQRLLFQAGYQHILGSGEGFNLFLEGGLHATLAKFDQNEIEIENLRIDLYESYYNPQNGATYYTGTKPVGLGFGAFAGLGVNIRTTSKWDLQLLYSLMLENVRIGYDQKFALNHGAGLRLYYKLMKKS